MIKGVSKKVIVIRDPQSELFEEAYFIIRSGKGLSRPSEDDMVTEANRLISAYCSANGADGWSPGDGMGKLPVRLAQPQTVRQSLPQKGAAQYTRKKANPDSWLRALICFAAGMAFTGMVFVLLRFVVFV